jgi:hypothetical protein
MLVDRLLRPHSRSGEELDGGYFDPPKGGAEVGLAGPPHFFFFRLGLTCIGRTLY